MIDLRVLGALDLRRRDGPELHSVLAQAKRTALLIYLELARPRGFHRRDSLIALFWPEHDTEHARNNLRQGIHFLRRSLGEDGILSRGDEDVRLREDVVSCDAVQFDAALDAGEQERALSLYAGDLLPGFFVDGAPDFEQWLEDERTRLRERAVRACWSLAEARERAADTAAAAEWGRRAMEIAPADDTQIMRLMQLLARAGDRSGALAAFDAYARRLRTELELEPTEAAAALAADIRRAEPARAERAEAAALSPARIPVVPIEPLPTPPAVPSSALRPPAGRTLSLDDGPTLRRDGVAPGLWLPGVTGVMVGIPIALLAFSLGHAVWPSTVPVIEADVLLAAAGLLLGDAALLALLVIRRRGPHVGAPLSGRVGAGLGFALGVLVAFSLAYTRAAPPPRPLRPGDGTGLDTIKRKVAVTRFVNLTGDPALEPVGRLAESWVVRRLRSIPEADVVAIAANTSADTSARAITKLARRTGADLVLFGSYHLEGSDVLLSAWLVPPRGGRISPDITNMAIGPVRFPRERPVGGVDRLASFVAGTVASRCIFDGCIPGRRAPMYEAQKLAQEAGQAYNRREYAVAHEKWLQANRLDSTFVNSYTHAAEQSTCAQKDSIGEILEARRQEFGLYDLLYMRVIRAYCHGDVERAYRLRRQMLDLAPRDLATQQGVAVAALFTGRLREAEARYRALVLRETAEGRPSLEDYAQLAYVLHHEGKIKEELRVAAEGRLRNPVDPQAFLPGLKGLAALARTQELEGRADEARRAGLSVLAVAEIYVAATLEAGWHGHAEAARQFARSGLRELDRASPEERAAAWYVRGRAQLLLELRRWREVLALADAGDPHDRFLVTLRGVASAAAGDTAATSAALGTLGRLPDSAFVGQPSREECQASVLAALGEKDDALRRLEDAQAKSMLPRSGPYVAHTRYPMLRALWHDPRFERMFAARD